MAKTARAGDDGQRRKGGNRRSPLPPPSGQPRTGTRTFVRESWGELRKVQWPNRAQVVQGTLVVGFVTAVFAIYLTVVDFFVVKLVNQVDQWLIGG